MLSFLVTPLPPCSSPLQSSLVISLPISKLPPHSPPKIPISAPKPKFPKSPCQHALIVLEPNSLFSAESHGFQGRVSVPYCHLFVFFPPLYFCKECDKEEEEGERWDEARLKRKTDSVTLLRNGYRAYFELSRYGTTHSRNV